MVRDQLPDIFVPFEAVQHQAVVTMITNDSGVCQEVLAKCHKDEMLLGFPTLTGVV